MRIRIGLICLALALAASGARGDILPPPDRGPPTGSAAGLDFAIEPVTVEMHGYTKTWPAVFLVGCEEGRDNCRLARSRSLIGMEVILVDGQGLRPEYGMVRQILDAFADKAAGRRVKLELVSRAPDAKPVEASFARR